MMKALSSAGTSADFYTKSANYKFLHLYCVLNKVLYNL